ncbi:MAG: hypothetical protein K8H74_19110 [Notoacmeibacter sp.]|nr:hypothetical protein [Notoacmeibacter sp.]
MKSKRFHIPLVAALALSFAILPSAGHSADGCYAIGKQVAAENGGRLADATAKNKGGQTVCVIVVLVPGGNGQYPRRKEIIVPLN